MELIIGDAFLFSVTEMLECVCEHVFVCDLISFVTFSTGLAKYPTLENITHFILSQDDHV